MAEQDAAGMQNDKRKRFAILEISPAVLRHLFQLPDGAEIIDMRVPIDRRGVIELKIEGAGWIHTEECQQIQRAVGTVTRAFDAQGVEARVSIDWGFPPDDE